MQRPLETVYRDHHQERRGKDFVLLGDVRGAFLRDTIGTGKRVLDIGCRDGELTKAYREGNEVLGLDIDSAALERARTKLGIEVRQVDLNGEWDVLPGAFDAVVAAEVLEHLYYPDRVLDRITAALTHDGVLVGSVPNAFSLINRLRYLRLQKKHTPLADPTHITHFAVEELRELLAARFEEVAVIGIGRLGLLAQQFPQTFAFDLCFSARRPKGRKSTDALA
jgi:2-polyprenyl-3-methyl-5-hydroxy-6-metoxy-1,4-benzoquinol methylase